MNYKKILKVVGVVAVAAFFCVGCGGDNGTGKEPDKPDIPDTPNSGGNPSGTTFQDSRDSTTYNRVRIGTQVWMAENLNYNATGSVCYNNSADSCAKYGRLYNWNDAKKACPAGWHLPSDDEWTRLTNFVGDTLTAGTKLKSSTGWNSDEDVPAGADQYGFSALPGGRRSSTGVFYAAGNFGLWWSATDRYAGGVWSRCIYYYSEKVSKEYNNMSDRLSVRCVED